MSAHILTMLSPEASAHKLTNQKNKIMANKKSIRFYNNHEVRAVWSDEECKWYFSATDVVRAINDEPDYVRAGNYWRWLKKKLKADGVQLVSGTHDFKLTKAKQRCLAFFVQNCPSKHQTLNPKRKNRRFSLHM